jgi:RNA polymerase sigma factor (sigma-70 family)
MNREETYIEDRVLVARILAPETREAGFRELLKKYQSRLYWGIRGMAGNHEDADDILQNTLLKIARHLKTYQGQSALMTWMYSIAMNECHSFLAAKKRFFREIPRDHAFRQESDSIGFTEEDAMVRLTEAVQVLPDKQRVVFCLRYFDGMPYEEMSVMTETSVGALKASYHHAVKKIEAFILDGKINS